MTNTAVRQMLALCAVAAFAGLGCLEDVAEAPSTTALTPLSHDVLFPIATGTHAGVECNTCHGDYDSFTHFNCTACHVHDRARIDPMHLGAVSGYSYGPETCYGCHPRGEALGFNHTTYFPIAAGTVHQGLACNTCHTDPANRKVFDCIGCHTSADVDSRHAAVAGYQHLSAECYRCHPDSSIPLNGVDHSTRFPIAAGSKHAGLACSTCHPNPNDRKVFDCVSCHSHDKAPTDLAHAAVAGYSYDSAACYRCHPQANVGSIDHSPYFPIAAGSKHAGIACTDCHTTPGDRKKFTCTGCHTHDKAPTDLNHSGIPGYAYDSAACLRCHPSANVVGLIDHTPYFPNAPGTRHQNISCSTCHTTPGNRKVVTCTGTCHPTATMTTRHAPVGGYQYTSATCLRCHADSQVSRVTAHLPFRIQSGTRHYRKSCLTCHPQSRTDKPYGADFVLAKVNCITCHGNKHGNTTSQSCLRSGCHPSGN